MPIDAFRWLVACLLLLALPTAAAAEPAQVTVKPQGNGAQLLVDGKPYEIKGAGGDASKSALAQAGANTFRTWGVGDETMAQLDEAEQLGLKVVVGIWLGHERHGFDYNNREQVARQLEEVRTAVQKYKDHPAVLAWGLGNEMEGFGEGDNSAIWSHLQECAAAAKQVDPNHPTLTTVAEIGGNRVQSIQKQCPAIDIIGINSYGGVMSLPERYRAAGGKKPYIVTEFGPPGTWEIGRNSFGSVTEPTSNQKAEVYAKAYQLLKKDPLCLGSFAFTWGFKQEATSTWYGLFLPNGSKTPAVDALTRAWSGKEPDNHCPLVRPLRVSAETVEPGQKIEVTLSAKDPDGDQLRAVWRLLSEVDNYFTGGDSQATPKGFSDAISSASLQGARLTMPNKPGKYRVYAFILDDKGNGSMANHPLLVRGEAGVAETTDESAVHVVLGEPASDPNYVPSGYMGDSQFITVDEQCRTDPHSGDACTKISLGTDSGWGGVVWQHPANDWGDQDGGFDLTGAKELSFYAKGEKGGERVKFGFGILDSDSQFPDTAKGETEVTLTDNWKQYTLDVEGEDLSRIKTGFYWVAASPGDSLTFYVDDIVYK